MDPRQAVAASRSDRIRASVTPYAERYVRLGSSLHVDEADVDAAVGSSESASGVGSLAHNPSVTGAEISV